MNTTDQPNAVAEAIARAVPSPFIDGTPVQWAWDSTSLGWLKECPRKYQYSMIEGWRTKAQSVHLTFGILYHKALESYDRHIARGTNHELSLIAVVRETLVATWDFETDSPWRASADLSPDDKVSLKCREFLIRTIVWYLDKFKADPARTLLGADGKPMVEMHFLFKIGFNYDLQHPYHLCGYLDRVVEFNDVQFVMDRKTTTTTIGTSYFNQYEPDNQMSLYTIAGTMAFKAPVRGVIVDAAQIAVGFSRFGRHIVQKTPEMLSEWMTDLKYWLRQAEQFAEKRYWPMNDKACNMWGGCHFREICSKSPVVREKFLESHFERKQWNPLELRGEVDAQPK